MFTYCGLGQGQKLQVTPYQMMHDTGFGNMEEHTSKMTTLKAPIDVGLESPSRFLKCNVQLGTFGTPLGDVNQARPMSIIKVDHITQITVYLCE